MTNHSGQPDLSLPEPPGRLGRRANGIPRGWCAVLVVLQVATLAFVVMRAGGNRSDPKPVPGPAEASSPHDRKTIAQQLENRSLDRQAAMAWEAYLQAAPADTDRAAILFRIGKLLMQAEDFERAATAFIRCEQLADENPDLQAKIGPRLVTCLRRLGLHGEVGRELSRRVEVGADDVQQGATLATLQGDPLTESDLDRMVARRVDQLLAARGGGTNATARQELLKQFSRPDIRQRLLQELLQTELCVRRARELQLDRSDEYRQARQALEDNLLASQFLASRLETIQPTDVDLESFYTANKQQYEQPESLDVVIIELAADEDPAAILAQVAAADDFKKLAAERRAGLENDSQQPATDRVGRGQRHPRLGAADALFQLDVGAWTTEPHRHEDRRYLVLVERKTAARTPPLAEVRPRVQTDYIARKREELTRVLFAELAERYQVKMMPAAAATEPESKTDP